MKMFALTRGNINLIWELTSSEFKLRYQNSVLGFLWTFLGPLFMLGTLYVVFHMFMRIDVPHYELFLLIGIILWNFFARGTTIGMNAILGKSALIKKTYFPRETLVISSCLVELLTTFFNLIIFLVFMVIFNVEISLHIIFLPIVLFKELVLIVGVSLILSALYVYFRDMVHIWEVVTNVGFWITPIIYPLSVVPAEYQGIYMLNPMARIISSAREIVVYQNLPSIIEMSLGMLPYLVILLVGYLIFKKLEPRFAEEV